MTKTDRTNGIIIAGERSGVGKTTVTLALLSCLRRQGVTVQSFKVGPDYIDPMFHRHVTGRPCRNLDPVLTSEAYVQQCFKRHTQDVGCTLVEGVMGLFDGAAGREDFASTAHIARLLELPVLLVLDCSRLSHSIAAIVHGYRSFDPRVHLAGVVLNRVGSDRHLDLLKSALQSLQVPVLGVLRRQDSITIPDRHLGLVPTGELEGMNHLVEQLAHLGDTCFDWQRLMPLLEVPQGGAENRQMGTVGDSWANPLTHSPTYPLTRIAIAYDAAFNFYYADNLDLLRDLGAELVFWSPLQERLPDQIQGLYLGGGFPEVFAAQLAENETARHAVRVAIAAGMPTYAECGGLMYLCRQIVDFEGRSFPMVGTLPADAVMGKRLTLGYRQVRALQDGVLLERDAIVWGHEFHRSSLSHLLPNLLYEIYHPDQDNNLPPSPPPPLPHPSLHASYVHLHWGATPEIPQRFLQHCVAWNQ